MVVQPHELTHDGPHILAARRQLDPQQLLDCMEPRYLIRDRRNVIHPIDDRDILVEVEVLAELFETAVQIADIWHRIDDALTVECQNYPQGRVRRRMLRPKV